MLNDKSEELMPLLLCKVIDYDYHILSENKHFLFINYVSTYVITGSCPKCTALILSN